MLRKEVSASRRHTRLVLDDDEGHAETLRCWVGPDDGSWGLNVDDTMAVAAHVAIHCYWRLQPHPECRVGDL